MAVAVSDLFKSPSEQWKASIDFVGMILRGNGKGNLKCGGSEPGEQEAGSNQVIWWLAVGGGEVRD